MVLILITGNTQNDQQECKQLFYKEFIEKNQDLIKEQPGGL